ncbi:hypothetical protein T484DRAFT_1764997, partial [Baffinella frigidus]
MQEAKKKAQKHKKRLEELERKKEEAAEAAALEAKAKLEREAGERTPWGETLECLLEFHGFESQEGARSAKAAATEAGEDGVPWNLRTDGQTIPEMQDDGGEEGGVYVPPDQ